MAIRSARREDGFALIELLLMVVIIGIIASIAVPNLLASRRSANGASAVEATRLFHSTEVTYQAGVGNSSFGSARNLFDQDFIDGVLAQAAGVYTPCKKSPDCAALDSLHGGRAFGYHFALEVSPDMKHFSVHADPAAINRTGDRAFFVDETGVIRSTPCPPGQKLDPVTNTCEPSDSKSKHVAMRLIQGLDAATGGAALEAARKLVCGGTRVTEAALMALDADGDGMIGLEELATEDLVDAARRAMRGLSVKVPGNVDERNRDIRGALRMFQQDLSNDLALNIADEKPVMLPIAGMNSDLCGFFSQLSMAR